MDTEIEQMIKLKDEIEQMEEAVKIAKKPYLDEVNNIQAEMDYAVLDRLNHIHDHREKLSALKQRVLDNWKEDSGATVTLADGTKAIRSATRAIWVLKTRELLEATLNLISEEDKLPFKVKRDNKILMPLVETGVIPKNLTEIETSYRLAVRKPKV